MVELDQQVEQALCDHPLSTSVAYFNINSSWFVVCGYCSVLMAGIDSPGNMYPANASTEHDYRRYLAHGKPLAAPWHAAGPPCIVRMNYVNGPVAPQGVPVTCHHCLATRPYRTNG